MFSANSAWFRNPGASNDALQSLREGLIFQKNILNCLHTVMVASLPMSPFNFCLDSAEVATNNKVENIYEEFFPGFLYSEEVVAAITLPSTFDHLNLGQLLRLT
jgi:hypothetical protein